MAPGEEVDVVDDDVVSSLASPGGVGSAKTADPKAAAFVAYIQCLKTFFSITDRGKPFKSSSILVGKASNLRGVPHSGMLRSYSKLLDLAGMAGTMTFRTMTLGKLAFNIIDCFETLRIMTLSISVKSHYSECRYAE